MNRFLVQELPFFFLMIVAMSFWGASWASAKVIAHCLHPDVIVFLRQLLTFLSFFLVVFIFARDKCFISPRYIFWVILPSIFFVAYNKLFFEGLRVGLAGKGGVIVTTMNPLLTFFITITFLRQKVGKISLMGLIIGFIGGLILLRVWETDMQELIMSGNLYFVSGALVWAILTVITSSSLKRISYPSFCLYVYGINTILSFLLAFPHHPEDALHQDHVFWLNMVFLSIVAIAFATSVYFFASRKIGANRTSSFTFIVPFTALLTCWLFLHEVPNLTTISGGFLALLAIYMINLPQKKQGEITLDNIND